MYDEDALICPLKVTEDIKYTLKYLKDKIPDDFEGERTYNAIISFLICEYERFHDPKRQEERQREIDKKYVTVERWTADVEEYRKKYEEFDKVTNELNDKLQSIEIKLIDAESKVKEQTGTIEGLQNNLSYKNNEISVEKGTVDKLTQLQTQLQKSLNAIHVEYNLLVYKYNKEQHNTNTFFLHRGYLETLYFIGRYLKRHPKKLFTAKEIHDKLQWRDDTPSIIIEDIQYALTLTKYKVLPVRCVNTPDGIAYQYDRRYLH